MTHDHAKRIARTPKHVDAHLDGDLSLDALAGVAALSRFHFSRVFRGQTGEGVAAAVRRRRLNRAALLVAATRDPMPDIATRAGLGHVGTFERAFRAAFGKTPRQVRQAGTIPPPLLPPRQGEYAMFPTDIREGEDIILAALPHTGAYQDIGGTFEALAKGLMARGLWSGSGQSFGIYHDDPAEVPTAELRAHAGHRLAPGKEVPDGFDRVVLAGGTFLVLTCKGPYSKLPEAWGHLHATALPESGRAFREGLPFERYLTDPRDTRPEDHVTEIWVPVA